MADAFPRHGAAKPVKEVQVQPKLRVHEMVGARGGDLPREVPELFLQVFVSPYICTVTAQITVTASQSVTRY